VVKIRLLRCRDSLAGLQVTPQGNLGPSVPLSSVTPVWPLCGDLGLEKRKRKASMECIDPLDEHMEERKRHTGTS
jgi:hypothetical protein